jgi:hypothetical protein
MMMVVMLKYVYDVLSHTAYLRIQKGGRPHLTGEEIAIKPPSYDFIKRELLNPYILLVS